MGADRDRRHGGNRLFLREDDAERALAECLRDEPEGRALLHVQEIAVDPLAAPSLNWAPPSVGYFDLRLRIAGADQAPAVVIIVTMR